MRHATHANITLSMPQRLASMRAELHVKPAGRWVRAGSVAGVRAIVPVRRVWSDDRRPMTPRAIRASLLEEGAVVVPGPRARVTVAGRDIPVMLLADPGRRALKRHLVRAGLDVGWLVRGEGLGPVLPFEPEGATGSASGVLAGAGRLVDELGDAGIPLPRWRTARRPHWVRGGSLEVPCVECQEPLQWWDWWDAEAEGSERTWFAYCPAHGGPLDAHRGRPLQPLIDARRQLDVALAIGGIGGPAHCYVVEVRGLGADHVYVGQTTKRPAERLGEHRSGGDRAARVFRRVGVSPGSLRDDLVGEIPPLHGRLQALTAERWIATHLRHAGYTVHGGH